MTSTPLHDMLSIQWRTFSHRLIAGLCQRAHQAFILPNNNWLSDASSCSSISRCQLGGCWELFCMHNLPLSLRFIALTGEEGLSCVMTIWMSINCLECHHWQCKNSNTAMRQAPLDNLDNLLFCFVFSQLSQFKMSHIFLRACLDSGTRRTKHNRLIYTYEYQDMLWIVCMHCKQAWYYLWSTFAKPLPSGGKSLTNWYSDRSTVDFLVSLLK